MSAVLFWGSWIHLNAFRVGLDFLLGPAIVVEASPAATAGNANKSRLQCYTSYFHKSESQENILSISHPCPPSLLLILFSSLADCTALSTSPADACAILASCGEGIDPIAGWQVDTGKYTSRMLVLSCIYLWCPEIQRSARNQCKSQFQEQCEESCMFLSLFFKACQPSRRQKAYHLWVKAQVVGQLLPAGVSQED